MRSLSILGAAVCLLSTVAAVPQYGSSTPAPAKKRVAFTDVFSGNFSVKRTALQWTAQGGVDGNYVEQNSAGDLVFSNIVSGKTSVFVAASDIGAAAKDFYDYSIQASGEHVLFTANYTKLYRHSFYADYYVYNVASKKTVALAADQVGDIQYATFAPAGNTIAYVRGNNLFIWKDGVTTQVTKDGSPDRFNGVPDWVYEEEIFGTNSALWFSPDGLSLAFLKIDETGVPTFDIQYYLAHQTTAPPYPEHLKLRYPKVGATNPTVTFQLLNIQKLAAGPTAVKINSFPPEQLIIGEVAWVTDAHSRVIVRAFDRVQEHEKLVLVDTATGAGKVVRERDGSDGWLEPLGSISYISGTNTYLDMHDASGWMHLYIYPVDGSTPVAITKGNWEVVSVVNVDVKAKLIYYVSTERATQEKHLYSIDFKGNNKKALVDNTKPGIWTASFSALGGYYILSYNGPDLPWQKLYATKDTKKAIKTINDNAALATRLAAYELPKVSWFEIKHPDGYSFNVMQRLPPGFDPKKKYAVLFDPYGGPNSQQTAKTFRQVDFRAYLASDPDLQFIILTVDNRGTAFKGRKYRNLVVNQLGKLEPKDQVYAAQWYAKKNSFVDASKIAIMGWSYGGYLAAKVVELNSDAFSFAIITAPVSDWRFYDSMYTERYMKSLSANSAGYAETAVRNATGFQNIRGGVLIQHGTGDDNVHFQNGAVLVDTLTNGRVSPKKLHTQWFTDSDHNINVRGATTLVYKQMARYLWLEKQRKEGEAVHQFDRRMEEMAELGPRGLDVPEGVYEGPLL